MDRIVIYTDGACKGNPGPGGWGALLIYNGHRKELYGGEKETTNNRMELKACIEALSSIQKDYPIELYTDSTYVKNGINDWIANWRKKGWKTSSGKPVKNKDLWQHLDDLNQALNVSWLWVKGHSGDPGNERADWLANQGIVELEQ